MNQEIPRVGFVSLGCPKALVDSEQIITRLRAEGYEIAPSYQDANLVVINTCGFIESAIEESLDAIDEAMRENGQVIVTGCLGKNSRKILDEFPQVLAVTGPHAYEEVMQQVHQHLPAPHAPDMGLIPPQGLKLTPRHYAYLKISEGCGHQCSFCIIPALRGDLESRPIGEVLTDAENLVNAGVKELLVVAQDTGAYGLDIKYRTGFWNGSPIKTRLSELVHELGDLDAWVRLHYIYPYPHIDDLVPLMADGQILPYLDIPLQHASPGILKAMRRPASDENMLKRISHWREICPDISIRSSFILGFPGETEEDFQHLLRFVQEAQFDRVGCFTYSPVEGAAANALVNQIDESLKADRMAQLMEVQHHISEQRLKTKIGESMTVLVDTIEDDIAIARSAADAPDIDGLVLIENGANITEGEFARVQITGSDEHDLYAKICSD